MTITEFPWLSPWNIFKTNLPHQKGEFSKRNWGNELHSLCSYQGKMKPSIAHHLISTFTSPGDRVFDPFSGVGTIPLESSLGNRHTFAMDLSELAVCVTSAKLGYTKFDHTQPIIDRLKDFIENYEMSEEDYKISKSFGYNGKLQDYFHRITLSEIFASRRFISRLDMFNPNDSLVIAALLHVLHGNRPYALSRRSHPITPYAPTGDYEYKSVIEKIESKILKTRNKVDVLPSGASKVFHSSALEEWPQEISDINAIITSPPFFDSTKFHMANWMRLWLMGWNSVDYTDKPKLFLDEMQKSSMDIYDRFFDIAMDRLTSDGIIVMHLGKSHKMDMAVRIAKIASKYFSKHEIFVENVDHCESHGISDKGFVKEHQYLVLSRH